MQLFHFDLGLPFDVSEQAHVLIVEEGDAHALAALPCGSARAVDVGLCGVGRLCLDDYVDLGEVEPAGCDVGGDDAFQVAGFVPSVGFFPLGLGDVRVEAFAVDVVDFL